MTKLHLRCVSNEKLDLESLMISVNSGTYSENLVSELLFINDYVFLPSADRYPRITAEDYSEIRSAFLSFQKEAIRRATSNGMTNESQARRLFDELLYESILTVIPLTDYEASQSGIWDFITVRVLLDVAVWRFDTDVVADRFIGLHRARHVFARWWFRRNIAEEAEVAPNYSLLETEWETVFERPSLCWNPSVANACLRVLQETQGPAPDGYAEKYKQPPKRIWIKRIMRLTSQSTLDAFSEDDLHAKFWALHPYNEA